MLVEFPTTPPTQTLSFPVVPPRHFHQALQQGDALSSSGKKTEQSFATKVWNAIACFFSAITCGWFNKAEEIIEDVVIPLMELKEKLSKVKDEFISQRDADQTPNKDLFKKWWKETFTNLPQEVKERILKEDMRAIAKYELLEKQSKKGSFGEDKFVPSEAAIDAKVEENWIAEKGQNASYKFVDDLEYAPADPLFYQGSIPNPLEEVPQIMERVLQKIEKEIKEKKL